MYHTILSTFTPPHSPKVPIGMSPSHFRSLTSRLFQRSTPVSRAPSGASRDYETVYLTSGWQSPNSNLYVSTRGNVSYAIQDVCQSKNMNWNQGGYVWKSKYTWQDDIHERLHHVRAGVEYVLSNTNLWIFLIQMQVHWFKYKYFQSNISNLFRWTIRQFYKSLDICSWSVFSYV